MPTCSLYPQQKRAYCALHPQAWTYIHRSMPEGTYRVQSPGFPKIVYCYILVPLAPRWTKSRHERMIMGGHLKGTYIYLYKILCQKIIGQFFLWLNCHLINSPFGHLLGITCVSALSLSLSLSLSLAVSTLCFVWKFSRITFQSLIHAYLYINNACNLISVHQ